jgi:23S rRNA (pseudouridine1915-N3)-methyltransferase
MPPPVIVELEVRPALPPALSKAREAELILKAVPAGAPMFALDARGEGWSSEEFAERLRGLRDAGVAELAFAIGGADGLDRSVLDRAERIMSFGRMTWPHLLARGMLLEQLYRAQQIFSGHPYHRG